MSTLQRDRWTPRGLVARVRSGLVGRKSVPVLEKASTTVAFMAVFAAMVGVGSRDWLAAAAGATLLPAAAALHYVAYKRQTAPVRGTAHVLATPVPDDPWRCLIQAAVAAPEIWSRPIRAVIREHGVPPGKWPYKGDRLPVDITYWNQIRVAWGAVPSRGDTTGTEDPFTDLQM